MNKLLISICSITLLNGCIQVESGYKVGIPTKVGSQGFWCSNPVGSIQRGGFSAGSGIGGGDVKLGLILGLLAGTPLKAMLMLFIASLIGTLAAVPVMLKQKTGMGIKLPFGPFLLAGCILVVLLGDKLISAYLTTFGLS
jgi:prepilin signal peptidase PulO-like enzyme (type II secretory pathway)